MGARVCAMVIRDSGHVCDTMHPACKHRRDKKAAKQESRRHSKKTNEGVAQLLAWMTAGNQQLGRSRLQKWNSTLIIWIL